MDAMNQKIEIMRDLPVSKALIKLGVPTMIGMLVTAIYNLVDSFFVRGLGTSQMGAISILFPISMAIVGLGMMFGSGAGSFIARLLGAKDLDKANRVASTALYTSLGIGVAVSVVVVIFLDQILYGLGASSTIFPYAKEYALIYVSCSLFNIFNVTMNNIVINEGKAKMTMMAMLLGAGLNAVLDPIFIFAFKMGVSGAAVATVLSQFATSIIYIRYIILKKGMFSFSLKNFKPDKEIYVQIIKVGLPTLVFQLLTSVATSLTNVAALSYGDAAIAAMGVVTRIMTIGTYVVFGFSKGFQPIVGYSFGAMRYDRLKEAVRKTLQWTSVFCVGAAAIFVFFSKPIIAAFTSNDTQVIEIGSKALTASGATFAFFGVFVVYSTLFLALGKAGAGSLLSISRQGYFFIPIILIMPRLWGLDGVIYAQPLTDVLVVVLTVVMALKINKTIETKRKEQEKDRVDHIVFPVKQQEQIV